MTQLKTVGFCSVSQLAYSMAWQILYEETVSYPFTKARNLWNITTAGLNHFVWLVDFVVKATDTDMLPLCQRTALVTDTIVQAGLKHSRALVDCAIELDPTILDTAAGIRAINACLEAHADMLPYYQ